jgi:hypothetical protein
MMCTAPRCADDAEYVVHDSAGVARPACGVHAAAATLFGDVADVRPMPTRTSSVRAKRPRHA